jgi:hypothetical protein
MAFNLGANPIASIKLGSAPVSKIIQGSEQIWPVAPAIGTVTITGVILPPPPPPIGTVTITGIIVPPPFDPELYITNVEIADGQALEDDVKIAMRTLIADLEATSGFAAMDSFIPGIGGRTLAGGMVPLIGPAPVLFNIASGDYDRKLGLSGDGINKALSIATSAGSAPDNLHISFLCNDYQGDATFLMGRSRPGVHSTYVIIFQPELSTQINSAVTDGINPWVVDFVGIARNGLVPEIWNNTVTLGRTTDIGDISSITAGPPMGFLCQMNDSGTAPQNVAMARGYGFSTGAYYDQPMAVRAALVRYQTALATAIP